MKTLVAIAVVLAAVPAHAAVTARAAVPEDGPRLGWFERYQESRQGPEQIEKISQTHKVGDHGALDLSHLAGDIRVTGGAGSEIKIDATKRVRHRDAGEAKRLLGALRVDINSFNGRVEVRTIYPSRGQFRNNISASVDYVISVPVGTMVALKSISGDISVSHVKGEVRAETVSGDVNIVDTPNVTIAKTISGDVTARDIGTETTLVLSTVSGSVLGTGLRVRALEAGSVSGDVRLLGSEVGRLEAKSVSGNIEFDAPLTKSGRYEFTSHSGNVRIFVSGNTGFELDADTFSGNVRSDVPVTLRAVGRSDDHRDRGRARGAPRMSSRAIRGTYGDASAYLSVRSHSGSVVITKK
ncbi:MAG TPA: DUF4097 family beta strand repeat-containing protein [Vicinamibacterales bacterium]|nr:DUF4097 family beta strand repeat-containing protein [Vicinamibacterales bacterium]